MTVFVITYVVSTSAGHGEGSYQQLALWSEPGAFTTRELAQMWLDKQPTHYGMTPQITELVLH